ncbi:hypothetical protein NOR51B_2050 [Luminiphilus syltensis NOR5-1B]|uniref:Uncharacterized protein n=1 Tax=Luminiphilus syltensis NOR5-1B TaxID=565045 RepID=B8KUC5_9GAMM|nr:sulfotransferase [Luminiphilus syltensis]EED36102.1 hypothetical protein NOR51B_2050 [Luminiphilus syltensis NOR5-1B]
MLHKQGDLTAAEAGYRQILATHPDEGATWHLLAVLMGQRGDHNSAAEYCRRALLNGYRAVETYANLAAALSKSGSTFEAAEAAQEGLDIATTNSTLKIELVRQLRAGGFERSAFRSLSDLEKYDPDDRAILNELAQCSIQLGSYPYAKRALTRLSRLEPGAAEHKLNLSLTHFMGGEKELAAMASRESIAIEPDLYPGYYLLTKTIRLSKNDPIATDIVLKATSARGLKSPELQFAAGNLHHGFGDFDAAFTFYKRGNSLVRRSMNYGIAEDERRLSVIASQIDGLTSAPLPDIDYRDVRHRPVFIVGMPRTGSTLLESMMTRYPDITSAGEMVWMQRLVRASLTENQLTFPEGMAHLPDSALAKIRSDYSKLLAENVPVSGTGKESICIDKLPGNLLYIPLILRVFPESRIIITTRDRASTCLSCFIQLFSSTQQFAYDLHEASRFWEAHMEIIRSAESTAGSWVSSVKLADLLQEPQKTLDGLLAFCGAERDADLASADYSSDDGLFRTASALQIRASKVDPLENLRRYHHLLPSELVSAHT